MKLTWPFKRFHFQLIREKAGVISPGPTWVCLYGGCYIHYNESLVKLLWEVVREYKHDRHLGY